MNSISLLIIPLLILFILIYAYIKKINAYDAFIKGSKEGINLFKEVFPSICAMMLCVSLLKACGIIDDISKIISKIIPQVTNYIDIIPMILFRPISGSASIACLDNICKQDANSFLCKMASTIQGATDTTIYVLALYFTSVGIKKWKHALKVGLIADFFGISIGIILSFIFLKN